MKISGGFITFKDGLEYNKDVEHNIRIGSITNIMIDEECGEIFTSGMSSFRVGKDTAKSIVSLIHERTNNKVWSCDFCGSSNKHGSTKCSQCGGSIGGN